MKPITCPNPSCKSIVTFPDDYDAFQRSSDEFCKICDTPLFWAPTGQLLTAATPGSEKTRRRLPGAGPTGQAALGSRACPECHERNTLKADFCYRCGADMHPKPAPPLAPIKQLPPPVVFIEPEPEPEPEPEDFIWLIISVLTVVLTIALVMWLA